MAKARDLAELDQFFPPQLGWKFRIKAAEGILLGKYVYYCCQLVSLYIVCA